LKEGKKIYFASDFHLGVPDYERSLQREKRIVEWLDMIKSDAEELYLLGDVFDFWFEYRTVVPKGYVRLLGKLAEISDAGIKIEYFTGNHDMWTFDYLEKELNVSIYRHPVEREYNGKQFYIGHGDGLGPGDNGYKFIKKVFASKISQWLFARLHPNAGIGLADYFSRKSRVATGNSDETFLGEENEWLVIHSKELLKQKHFDFLIFGHRHLPLDITINGASRYINLGDWIRYNSYGEFDGKDFKLKYFDKEKI
jgi:UDP-2,3-diacylglucosamine hydrolase